MPGNPNIRIENDPFLGNNIYQYDTHYSISFSNGHNWSWVQKRLFTSTKRNEGMALQYVIGIEMLHVEYQLVNAKYFD